MTGPAQTYAAATKGVLELITALGGNDPSAAAYMVARAALLTVDRRRAAEMAYRLADEFAGEAQP